jgi:hypothetical protein
MNGERRRVLRWLPCGGTSEGRGSRTGAGSEAQP